MIWYATASLLPAVLLLLGGWSGGYWAGAGLFSITVLVFLADRVPNRIAKSARSGRGLAYALAGMHFVLLWVGVWSIGAATHLTGLEKMLLFIGTGLFFGQVSNSNAHELIHAGDRTAKRIGVALYSSLLNGHHVSAHLHVHHVHVATDRDPNSARLGEGFWAFALRAGIAEFREGLKVETARRERGSRPKSHPYRIYGAGAALALGLSGLIAGAEGMIVHLGLAAYALLQLLLSDYVQHYGLRRTAGVNGRTVPVDLRHSWNAPQWYSSAMMLNAPRHSDHHLNPGRAFPALEHDRATMPTLPRSLPVMAVIALFPPVWRRLMDARALRWQSGG